jgi:hypothetical protein
MLFEKLFRPGSIRALECRQFGNDKRSRMTNSVSELERQLNELTGALNLLVELRQEFAQWLEKAEDGSKREELENVLGHIEALEREHRNRREEQQKKAKSA